MKGKQRAALQKWVCSSSKPKGKALKGDDIELTARNGSERKDSRKRKPKEERDGTDAAEDAGGGVGTSEMGRLGRETAEVGKLEGWRSCRAGESAGVGNLEGWRSCRDGESTGEAGGVEKLQGWRSCRDEEAGKVQKGWR